MIKNLEIQFFFLSMFHVRATKDVINAAVESDPDGSGNALKISPSPCVGNFLPLPVVCHGSPNPNPYLPFTTVPPVPTRRPFA